MIFTNQKSSNNIFTIEQLDSKYIVFINRSLFGFQFKTYLRRTQNNHIFNTERDANEAVFDLIIDHVCESNNV